MTAGRTTTIDRAAPADSAQYQHPSSAHQLDSWYRPKPNPRTERGPFGQLRMNAIRSVSKASWYQPVRPCGAPG